MAPTQLFVVMERQVRSCSSGSDHIAGVHTTLSACGSRPVGWLQSVLIAQQRL